MRRACAEMNNDKSTETIAARDELALPRGNHVDECVQRLNCCGLRDGDAGLGGNLI